MSKNPNPNPNPNETDDPNNGQDPNVNPNPNPNPEGNKGADDKEFNFQQLRKTHDEIVKENKKLKKQIEDQERQRLEAEGKKEEMFQKDLETANGKVTKLQARVRKTTVEAALRKAGINEEFLDIMVPSITEQVSWNDDEDPENLDTLLASLKESKPTIFGTQPAQPKPAGKVGANASGDNTGTGMSREQALEIFNNPNKSEYLSRKKEIDAIIYNK